MRFSISLRFTASLDTTEVDNLLKSLQNNDLRIIFGFFGHEHARYILCQVRTSTYIRIPDVRYDMYIRTHNY